MQRAPTRSAAAFVSHRENQSCVMPPSTTSSDPVMKEESSLARNRAALAISLASPLEAVTEDQIDRQFDVNFKGVFFAIQKAAPLLAKGGSIIVTTSFLNEMGAPGLSILSATKGAVRSLVRSLGAEFAPRGIRVNAVSPGLISTPFHGKLGLSEKQLNDAASAIGNRVPLHRFGEAGEIAKAALFLASDDSSFMTGSELVVDGGLTQI